jgi:hypothetical protein
MKLGDQVIVSQNNHPLYKFTGTIVGRRGFRVVRDTMLLILINERQRSYLIPESMVNLVSDSVPDVEKDKKFN